MLLANRYSSCTLTSQASSSLSIKDGWYSRAPIALLPTKARRSTGDIILIEILCSFAQALKILWLLFQKCRRRQACDLLEHAAEMVGIVEAQQVRHFAHAQTFHQEILGLVNHEIVYITDGGSASGMVNQITEVTG